MTFESFSEVQKIFLNNTLVIQIVSMLTSVSILEHSSEEADLRVEKLSDAFR